MKAEVAGQARHFRFHTFSNKSSIVTTLKILISAKLFSKLFRRNRHEKPYCGEIVMHEDSVFI